MACKELGGFQNLFQLETFARYLVALDKGSIDDKISGIALSRLDEVSRQKNIQEVLGCQELFSQLWPVCAKSFMAHIMEIKGEAFHRHANKFSRLEGMPSIVMLALRIETLSGFYCNQNSDKRILDALRKSVRAFYFNMALSAIKQEQVSEGLGQLSAKAVELIEAEEEILFVSGFRGHQINILLYRDENINYVRLYNTGELVEFHSCKCINDRELIYPYFGRLPGNFSGKNLLDYISCLLGAVMTEDLFEVAKIFYGVPKKISKSSDTLCYPKQTIGNCTYASYSAFLVDEFNDPDNQLFNQFIKHELMYASYFVDFTYRNLDLPADNEVPESIGDKKMECIDIYLLMLFQNGNFDEAIKAIEEKEQCTSIKGLYTELVSNPINLPLIIERGKKTAEFYKHLSDYAKNPSFESFRGVMSLREDGFFPVEAFYNFIFPFEQYEIPQELNEALKRLFIDLEVQPMEF